MSDVKVCNRHGGIFVPEDDTYGKFTGEIHHKGENDYGATEEFIEHVTWHFCGPCLDELTLAGKKARRRQYIRELEKENNLPPLEADGA